mgnify:CR=1 FL=1
MKNKGNNYEEICSPIRAVGLGKISGTPGFVMSSSRGGVVYPGEGLQFPDLGGTLEKKHEICQHVH